MRRETPHKHNNPPPPNGPMGFPIYAKTLAKLMMATISPPSIARSMRYNLRILPFVDIKAKEVVVTLVDSEDE